MRSLVIASVATLCAVAAGCGTGDRERDAAQAASGFLAAAARGDTEAACALLAPRTREYLTTSDGQPCAQALPADRLHPATIRTVRVRSGWAQVDTDANTVFLTEFDDGWRVVAAECAPAERPSPYRCVVGS